LWNVLFQASDGGLGTALRDPRFDKTERKAKYKNVTGAWRVERWDRVATYIRTSRVDVHQEVIK